MCVLYFWCEELLLLWEVILFEYELIMVDYFYVWVGIFYWCVIDCGLVVFFEGLFMVEDCFWIWWLYL